MSAAAVNAGEPVPQIAEAGVPVSRKPAGDESHVRPFDSLLVKNHKPAKSSPETARRHAEKKADNDSSEPVQESKTDRAKPTSNAPNAPVDPTQSGIVCVLSEQNLPTEKNAVAVEPAIENASDFSDGTTAETSVPASQIEPPALPWLIGKLKSSQNSKTEIPTAIAPNENPIANTETSPANSTKLPTQSDTPDFPIDRQPASIQGLQALSTKVSVQESTAVEQVAPTTKAANDALPAPQAKPQLVLQPAQPQVPAPAISVPEATNPAQVSVVLKPAGMSAALHSSIMQNAPANSPANLDHQPISPATSVLAMVPARSSGGTSENFKHSADGSQNSFDGQHLFSANIAPAAKLESAPIAAPVENFSAALEKTQRVQTVVNHVIETATRMRSDGRQNVEVQVPLRDGGNLTIKLHWANGELTPTFKTSSAELRDAIQQNWNQFSSNSTERGMKITAPVFESQQSATGDLNQRQNRQQEQQQAQANGEIAPFFTRPKTASRQAPQPANSRDAHASDGLALYA